MNADAPVINYGNFLSDIDTFEKSAVKGSILFKTGVLAAVPTLIHMLRQLCKSSTLCNLTQLQSTTLNSSSSEYRKIVRIIRSAELTVVFNIGNQWSVS